MRKNRSRKKPSHSPPFRDRLTPPPDRSRCNLRAVTCVVALLLGLLTFGSETARAQIFPIVVSPDVDVVLGNEIVRDHQVVLDDLVSPVSPILPVSIANAAIDALQPLLYPYSSSPVEPIEPEPPMG